jgi:ParB/RepB/Spo0J family partition protein
MAVQTIDLSRIEKNPYRDLEGHPLRQEQVAALVASIGSTGFWEGLLVRPHPVRKDRYQLAFGHARWRAAQDAGIKRADFIVQNLDDDTMIRAMADENVTQFGRDEYATYREAVTAAVERIMGEVIADPSHAQNILRVQEVTQPEKITTEFINAIRSGEAPGERIIARYFNGTLALGAIRMALKEYHASGRLAAWHQGNNPKAPRSELAAKLDSKALGRFESVVHVQAFAAACEEHSIPPKEQTAVADHVLKALQDPEPKASAKTGKTRKKSIDYQRTLKPRDERLTANNIRRVVTETRITKGRTEADKRRFEAQAHAISIEGCLTEMSIGLRRSTKAASDMSRIVKVADGLIGVDMTPTAKKRLGECAQALREFSDIMEAISEKTSKVTLGRITYDRQH